jgi:mannose-6-phosphate isomerase-like protein (cupin superfamily)
MSDQRKPIVLGPGEGRAYAMPTMRAVFKADGEETASRYCVSEWWLKPHGAGPGAHSHEDNDEVFLVIAGTAMILVGDKWLAAPAGTVIVIPAGIIHDFRNDTDAEAGLFNVFIPGGFEDKMPEIVKWYEDNP